MNRYLLVSSLMISILFSTYSGAESVTSAPIVDTTYGKLLGQQSKAAVSFLGIPYGAPTGGKARFLPPQPPAAWQNVRDASQFGPRCPQPELPKTSDMASVLGFASNAISEDCLRLNVWTPAVDRVKRPVMVWFHGGGFYLGSGHDPYYEGSNLAGNNDVVVVTVTHRLNVFGFLALGPEAGQQYADSGMAGMLDLVKSLQWVRDNIAAFGGDPSNVTIFGQSGGGVKVSTLLAMPVAKGLFHKAIIMSGAGVTLQPKSQAVATSQTILQSLGVTSGDINALQTMPMERLLEAAQKAGLRAFFPAVDGKLLQQSPFDPQASELSARVPIMVGATRDEGAAALCNSLVLAERKIVQGQAPVYVYRVDWETPVLGGKLGSPHAIELPFVFDNIDTAEPFIGTGPDRQPLADAMSHSFAAFARSGNPDTAGMPHWPTYSLDKRATLIYARQLEVLADPDRAKCNAWQTAQWVNPAEVLK